MGDLVIFCDKVRLLDGTFRYGATFTATKATDQGLLRLEYVLATAPVTAND